MKNGIFSGIHKLHFLAIIFLRVFKGTYILAEIETNNPGTTIRHEEYTHKEHSITKFIHIQSNKSKGSSGTPIKTEWTICTGKVSVLCSVKKKDLLCSLP